MLEVTAPPRRLQPELGFESLVGHIATVPSGFRLYRPGQLEPVARVQWTGLGGADLYHRHVCLHLAYTWFRRGGEHFRLLEYRDLAEPAGYERWGWTRATRGVGSTLIWISDYQVWVA